MPRTSDMKTRIISYLSSNPKSTRQKMAKVLKKGYATVQRHIADLAKEGFLEERLHVTEKWGKERLKFWILIRTRYPTKQAYKDAGLDPDEGRDDFQGTLCRRIAHLLYSPQHSSAGKVGLIELAVVIGGDYDIVLSVTSDDHAHVSDFVTNYLRAQPEVESTMTSWRRLISVASESDTI